MNGETDLPDDKFSSKEEQSYRDPQREGVCHALSEKREEEWNGQNRCRHERGEQEKADGLRKGGKPAPPFVQVSCVSFRLRNTK